MNLMSQQLETLMTCHAWQQQAMLTRLGAIVQRRIQIQQQQSDKTALKVTRLGGMFSRKPHYELPAEIQGDHPDAAAAAAAQTSRYGSDPHYF